MIDGLHADVLAPELRTLLEDRAKHHEEKAAFYASKADGLDFTGHSRDPAADLKERARGHENSARHLRFLAAHLSEVDTYRLTQGDLHLLGIAERAY